MLTDPEIEERVDIVARPMLEHLRETGHVHPSLALFTNQENGLFDASDTSTPTGGLSPKDSIGRVRALAQKIAASPEVRKSLGDRVTLVCLVIRGMGAAVEEEDRGRRLREDEVKELLVIAAYAPGVGHRNRAYVIVRDRHGEVTDLVRQEEEVVDDGDLLKVFVHAYEDARKPAVPGTSILAMLADSYVRVGIGRN